MHASRLEVVMERDFLFNIQIWTDNGKWLVTIRSESGIQLGGGPYASEDLAFEGLRRLIKHAMSQT